MTTLILGLASVALGAFGLAQWLPEFLTFLKGLLPLSFICGGLIAVLAGISSLRK